jgi:metal-responsive CopG/Arc/MetJ family transcriptional regulator
MSNAVKVAISLPPAILDTVEEERRERGESRSEFFRQAVLAFLRDLRDKKNVQRYVQGYLEQPETADEVHETSSASHEVLAGEPWD